MSRLTYIEKDKLEDLLEMGGGYVLNFTDAKFASFFGEMGKNIDNPRYTANRSSRSKANRLRGFWEKETDIAVGTSVEKLVDYAEHLKSKNEQGLTAETKRLIAECRDIASKLTGKPAKKPAEKSRSDFLAMEFGEINFSKLPVEGQLHAILECRLDETQKCLGSGAYLATIFMAGSILEGVLLGAAQKHPEKFNKSRSCPKDVAGKPKSFADWTLAQLIDVARDVEILGEDVKKFSHALRDFRNYIHPYQQMSSGFTPNKDTAKICLQVLKAALSDLTESTR